MPQVLRGTVKWFNIDKGYGFITPAGGGNDVFVHQSAVDKANLRGLKEGQAIEYRTEISPKSKKLQACELRLA